ncbi:hypothetical protein A0H81_10430 [Grifola frondosa]|uniref:Uncharacterized protein n=1 Tax=Grifola frondosa TaxID=5627 RepID=A0A1C7LXN7_GRIFR|nr:hypothetical protein A0H81_10430 [Grifola frondosa]
MSPRELCSRARLHSSGVSPSLPSWAVLLRTRDVGHRAVLGLSQARLVPSDIVNRPVRAVLPQRRDIDAT